MSELGEFQKIDHLIEKMKQNGVHKLIFKRLSPNDNSKNQLYLGSSYDILQMLPMGDIYTDYSKKDSKRDRFKANINFYWLDTNGEIYHAPKSQLILYPKYPEVRLSGFLAQATKKPSEYMASRMENRIIIIGITNEQKIISHVIGPNNQISDELKQFEDPSSNIILKTIFDTSKSIDTRNQLLAKLLEIHKKGWVNGQKLSNKDGLQPYAGQNAGGYTLEALAGIKANGDNKPDYLGWELKQHVTLLNQPLKGGPVTLMTPEPTGGIYKDDGIIKFMNKFGYPDKNGIPNRLNFGGIHKYGLKTKITGLSLLLEGYDHEKKKISNVDGGIILENDQGEIAAKWHFSKLIEMWNKKHAQTAYIPCEKNKEHNSLYRYGYVVALGEGTNFDKFLFSLINGDIYYDPGIKLENISSQTPKSKKRSQIRIKAKDIPYLYEKCEEINLLNIK